MQAKQILHPGESQRLSADPPAKDLGGQKGKRRTLVQPEKSESSGIYQGEIESRRVSASSVKATPGANPKCPWDQQEWPKDDRISKALETFAPEPSMLHFLWTASSDPSSSSPSQLR